MFQIPTTFFVSHVSVVDVYLHATSQVAGWRGRVVHKKAKFAQSKCHNNRRLILIN